MLILGATALFVNPAHASILTRLKATGPAPSARSSPAVAAIGPDIYLFGGVFDDFSTGTDTFYSDLYRFETTQRRWQRLETNGPRPAARAFAGTVADPSTGRFVIYGGSSYGPGFQDYIAYDDLWVYSVRNNAWTQIYPQNASPIGRSRPSTWLVGHKLYVFGGVSNYFETLNDLWAYDFKTNRWSELIPNGADGSPPTRHEAQSPLRFRHGKLLIYGGESINLATGEFASLNDTWEYDISRNEWAEITPEEGDNISTGRNYAAVGVLGNAFFVHGGDVPGGEAGCGAPFNQNATNEIWRFDLNAQVWTQVFAIGDAPLTLKRHRGVEVGNRLYLFSGFNFECHEDQGPGQIWNTDVYTFEP